MPRQIPSRPTLAPQSSKDKISSLVAAAPRGETAGRSENGALKTSRLTANIRADLMSWLRSEALKDAAKNPDAKNVTTIRTLVEEAIKLLQDKRT